MKRLVVLILAFALAPPLVTCSYSESNTTAPKSSAAATATTEMPSNGDADLAFAGDAGYSYEGASELGNGSRHTNSGLAHAGSLISISGDISANNAYLLNIDTSRILYEKNSDERIAPASTSKMLTALTVLEHCQPDDTFTVGSEIELIPSDSSRAWLGQGDTLTVKQLLAAMLLPSGNDAAYTLAVNVGRRIADDKRLEAQQAVGVFVGAMNRKAEEVGAAYSHFVTPDGYDADGQYTTAADIAMIAKACLGNDILYDIMGSYRIGYTLQNRQEVTYLNTNQLLNPDSRYYYPNAIGLKTGNSVGAGSCLVSAAGINGQTYICVVMGSASADSRFLDILTIFSEIDPTLSVPAPTLGPPHNPAPSSAPGRRGDNRP